MQTEDEGTEHKSGAEGQPRPGVKRDSFPALRPIFPIRREVFVFHGSRVGSHVMEDLLEAILEHVKSPEIVDGLQTAGKHGEHPGKEETIGPAHQGEVSRYQ